jgi:hypothetical protein
MEMRSPGLDLGDRHRCSNYFWSSEAMLRGDSGDVYAQTRKMVSCDYNRIQPRISLYNEMYHISCLRSIFPRVLFFVRSLIRVLVPVPFLLSIVFPLKYPR